MVREGLQTILMISLVLVNSVSGFCTTRCGDSVNAADGRNSKSTTIRNSKSTDVEIRFEFISIGPNMDDSTAPLFITIRRDGRTRALLYGLRYQAKNVAAYEGTLPEAEVETLFKRVQFAFRLPKYRKDYRRGLIYEDNSFYLAVKSDNGKIKEMFGGDGPRPDEVRALLAEMSGLWKRLNEVSSADAYFTTRQMEEDRFKRVRQERGTNLTSIDSLPSELRSILIRAFNETYNFYPLNMTQYSQIQTYKIPIIYKGNAYELMLLASAKEGLSQSEGWRGIVPLKSARKDVEQLLGNPKTPRGSSYETSKESVFVQYSDGPCEKGWPYGWNVPLETVVMIIVSPKETVTLNTLNLDETKYQKTRDSHISSNIHLINHNEGIDIEVDELSGKVTSFAYLPRASDSHLLCAEGLSPGRSQANSFFKFDAYGDVPFDHERKRLDKLADEMKRQPDTTGYIIAYAGMTAQAGEAKARAECAKMYLIEKHKIKAERISAIDGGYREAREVELYVEPGDGPIPLPVPSLRPSKVKIIEQNRLRNCIDDLNLKKKNGS